MVLEAIREILPFEGAVLQLFNKNIGKLEEIISLGEMVSPTDFVDSELAEEFPAWVASHKKPILLSDVKIPSDTRRDKKGSCLIVPLAVDNRLIGIVTFAGDCCGFFREKDIRLLSVVGDHMAVSIDRLIYQNKLEIKNAALKKARKDLKRAQENIINNERLAAVRELAISMNHEINNPLSVIIGNIQYLLVIEKDISKMTAQRLKKIEAEALRIADLNHRLLEIDDLVSETYIEGADNIKMINIEKSSARG